MQDINKILSNYPEILDDRGKSSKVYKDYQLTGLRLADMLEDRDHKSLYIRLAKKHDNQELLEVAAKIAERNNIFNKGAYFMKVWFNKTDKNSNNQAPNYK